MKTFEIQYLYCSDNIRQTEMIAKFKKCINESEAKSKLTNYLKKKYGDSAQIEILKCTEELKLKK